MFKAHPRHAKKTYGCVAESVYDAWMADIASLKPKDRLKWKTNTSTLSDGSKRVTKYDGEHFYQSILGQKSFLFPPAWFDNRNDVYEGGYERPTTDQELRDFMGHRQIETYTGKHKSRHHSITIPTTPGQPVRR